MQTGDEIFEFGPFQADIQKRVLRRDGLPIALPGKAFEILVVLLRHSGQLVDKEQLIREVWVGTAVEDNNLTVNVSWLRKALSDNVGSPSYIVTVSGRGYRFIAKVRELSSETEQQAGAAPEVPPARRAHRKPLSWMLLVVCVAGSLAVLRMFPSRGLTDKPSITVLPFRVLNSHPDLEYLGVGLTDSLITRLSNMNYVIVRPLDSVLKVADRDALAAGRALGTETVISGSIQIDNKRARVSVQMVRVRDGASVWAETLDEEMTGPFTLRGQDLFASS